MLRHTSRILLPLVFSSVLASTSPSSTAEAVSGEWSTERVREIIKKHGLAQWASIEKTINNNLHITSAENIYLIAPDGTKYIDFNSQAICSNLGYTTPEIVEEVYKQMKEVTFLESRFFMATIRAKVIDALTRIMPEMSRFHFSESGATAVEAAIRFARVFSGKNKILASYRSFHGGLAGALTLTGGVDERHFYVDGTPMSNVIHFVDRFPFNVKWGDTDDEANENFLAYLEEVIVLEGPHTIGGLIIESIVGTHGIMKSPDGYLTGIQRLCKKYNIVFILDEVMGGFGRTGEWFAYHNYEGVQPDIVTMAKGLTSAILPAGCTAVNTEIGKYFETHNLPIGSTYNAHPAGLAAIYGALKMYEDKQINKHVRELDPVFRSLYSELSKTHSSSIQAARNVGLWGMIEVLVPSVHKADPNGFAGLIVQGLKDEGIFTLVKWHKHMNAVIVYTNPPLVITETQLRECVEKVSLMLSKVVDPLFKDEL